VVGAATLALDQRHLHRSAPNGPSGSEDAVSGADQHLLLRIREDATVGLTTP